ncbi:SIS domain-containing protein [Leptolyngbya sp. 7M]|uniref:SIS domain-containing protein n=1 Tax=Leptolyngbya sp. 7M TaxID=2812896 RepID=UPI001B8B1FF0|nr:SIS domain-containing protein [Leptolyngbya sp. 7M]QYO66181.1 SIS domain-containing protein [Leptolyngbya sp. 7M]
MVRTVFTNGCFDLIHPGHIDLLRRARELGDHLIVGINSDESVRRIKGNGRPIMPQEDRRQVLLGLDSVDEVFIFDELTPENLIKHINPDILVKGGDWKPEEIIGSDHVLSNGGKVFSLPLVQGYSSSNYFKKLITTEKAKEMDSIVAKTTFERSINEHIAVFSELLKDHREVIEECGELLIRTVKAGNTILFCGNGGSAADAQHIAAEFVGRYETERIALPAIALTTDTSALTALGNDYGFERVFARQVEALAKPGDCLIGISTSGNSPNVIAAVMAARKKGASVIGMTGANGKKLASLSDKCLMVPSTRTARIQEAHITVGHIWCEMVDKALSEANDLE